MDQKTINRTSYDAIASQWAEYRRNTVPGLCIKEFEILLPRSASVLDLGCGTGYPIATFFCAQGHRVTGIDISENMIAEAKALRLPGADFQVADVMEFEPNRPFDAVVAFDSIWHVEESKQPLLYQRLCSMVAEGGFLLFTSGKRQGTVRGEMYQKPFVYSSLDEDDLKDLLKKLGFEILTWAEEYAEEAIGTRDLLVVARKQS